MGYKKSKKKLLKYLERDDFPKFKSYLAKHAKLDVNEMKFEGGDSLLHLACARGLDHVVWFVLKHGGDPLVRNDRGQVPLHSACHFTLSESHYGYYDLVQPLMDKAPRCLSCQDENGITPRVLIRRIRQKLSQRGAKVDEAESSEESETKEDWESKIAGESHAEYAQDWGTYEDDFTDTRESGEQESHGAWSDRMYQEMSSKRRKQWEEQHQHSSHRKKQKTDEEARKQAEFQRKLEKEHEEYTKRAARLRQGKMVSRKAEYELQCAKVFHGENKSQTEKLGYSDIPWPAPSNWNREAESMKEFLLSDMDQKDIGAIRKYLKDQQVRWHPDRFKQKIGNRLREKDIERIMDKVKLVSQILNKIVTEEKDS